MCSQAFNNLMRRNKQNSETYIHTKHVYKHSKNMLIDNFLMYFKFCYTETRVCFATNLEDSLFKLDLILTVSDFQEKIELSQPARQFGFHRLYYRTLQVNFLKDASFHVFFLGHFLLFLVFPPFSLVAVFLFINFCGFLN